MGASSQSCGERSLYIWFAFNTQCLRWSFAGLSTKVVAVELEDELPPSPTVEEGGAAARFDWREGDATSSSNDTVAIESKRGGSESSVGEVCVRRALRFRVHYRSWSRRWDEWVESSRCVDCFVFVVNFPP